MLPPNYTLIHTIEKTWFKRFTFLKLKVTNIKSTLESTFFFFFVSSSSSS